MNTPMPTNKTESAKDNIRIRVLLEKLRSKLRNFALIDRRGHQVGFIQDAKLDRDRQLYLVIEYEDTYLGAHLFVLKSTHIQHVHYPNQSVFVDLSKEEIIQLPEYKANEVKGKHIPQSAVGMPISATGMDVVDEMPNKEMRYHESDIAIPIESLDREYEMENHTMPESSAQPDVVEEEVIRLLEERLIVDVNKRKVGEVIVRKEIETRMIEVPVRYEKLIVEQVSPEHKQLSEIELGHSEIPGFEKMEIVDKDSQAPAIDNQIKVSGEFSSPKAASLLLDAIATQRRHGCKKVRVELVLENEEHLKTYQEWFERCSSK